MTPLFTSDKQREHAADLKRLIARLEAGHGPDRQLGADILEAVAAPATMGDPTASVDCCLHLAEFLKQSAVRSLGKTQQSHPNADPRHIARLMCAKVLIIHLAHVERKPA